MGNYASDQKNSRFYGLKLSRNTDRELIEKLEAQESIQAYIKELIRKDIEEERKMNRKQISLDNGIHYMDADEAVLEIMDRNLWDAVVNVMDDETREAVANELAPCTEAEFLTRYLELAKENLILG